jgi:hypothetical protein
MENKSTIILVGISSSFLLLIIFGVLQEKEAKFLTLSSQWIFLSILPILIALFVGGYITKFKGFGVELESALKVSVSTSIELKATDALAEIPSSAKESIRYLENMPGEKLLSIRRLVFESGRKKYYAASAVREYLEKLTNLEFIEVRTKEGQFICYFPIKLFRGQRDRTRHYEVDMEKLERFVDAIEKDNVKASFSDIAISLVVKSSSSLVQVLKTMRDEQVDMAAVVSDSGRYLGVLFSRDVERKVADAVLRSKPA